MGINKAALIAAQEIKLFFTDRIANLANTQSNSEQSSRYNWNKVRVQVAVKNPQPLPQSQPSIQVLSTWRNAELTGPLRMTLSIGIGNEIERLNQEKDRLLAAWVNIREMAKNAITATKVREYGDFFRDITDEELKNEKANVQKMILDIRKTEEEDRNSPRLLALDQYLYVLLNDTAHPTYAYVNQSMVRAWDELGGNDQAAVARRSEIGARYTQIRTDEWDRGIEALKKAGCSKQAEAAEAFRDTAFAAARQVLFTYEDLGYTTINHFYKEADDRCRLLKDKQRDLTSHPAKNPS